MINSKQHNLSHTLFDYIICTVPICTNNVYNNIKPILTFSNYLLLCRTLYTLTITTVDNQVHTNMEYLIHIFKCNGHMYKIPVDKFKFYFPTNILTGSRKVPTV